ncbi:hypothetical protein KUCAC02_029850, partial [Chaenocephalus aceratus]
QPFQNIVSHPTKAGPSANQNHLDPNSNCRSDNPQPVSAERSSRRDDTLPKETS